MQTHEIEYRIRTLTLAELQPYLVKSASEFIPPLDEQVEIKSYAAKIFEKAVTFEAWYEGVLVGLIAAYFNDEQRRFGYITTVSSLAEYRGRGIATELLRQCIHYAQEHGFKEIQLEVHKDSGAARRLYSKAGFTDNENKNNFIRMKLQVPSVNDQVVVSVVCLAYNHEKWVGQTLEGILAQQTTFLFEILIGEDCSTDRTREICLEYKKKYPDKISLITSEKNVGPQANFIRTLLAARGKYIAFCDGDDYWTDPHKLQKQVDFLETHADYAICFHPVKIWQCGKLYDDYITWVAPETTAMLDLAKRNYLMTPSVVYRHKFFAKFPDEFSTLPFADHFLHILNARFGKIKQLPDVMAVYRIHGGNMWATKKPEERIEKWVSACETMLKCFANDTVFSRAMAMQLLCYYNFLEKCYRNKNMPQCMQIKEKIKKISERLAINNRIYKISNFFARLGYLISNFVKLFFMRSPKSSFLFMVMALNIALNRNAISNRNSRNRKILQPAKEYQCQNIS